jgi:hypothetical protein
MISEFNAGEWPTAREELRVFATVASEGRPAGKRTIP